MAPFMTTRKDAIYVSVALALGAAVGILAFGHLDSAAGLVDGVIGFDLACIENNLGAGEGDFKLFQFDDCEVSKDGQGHGLFRGLGDRVASVMGKALASPAVQQLMSSRAAPSRPSAPVMSAGQQKVKNEAIELTHQVFGRDAGKRIHALKEFAAKCGEKCREGATQLMKMDVEEIKRHMFVAASTVAMGAPLAAHAEIAENEMVILKEDPFNTAPYLAVILGTSIPVVFLITLYIQSMSQGTAESFRQPDSLGGTRYEDE